VKNRERILCKDIERKLKIGKETAMKRKREMDYEKEWIQCVKDKSSG
jgi:hypothetical protein